MGGNLSPARRHPGIASTAHRDPVRPPTGRTTVTSLSLSDKDPKSLSVDTLVVAVAKGDAGPVLVEGVALPRAARKHAEQIICVRRGVPLYDDESTQELDRIWERATGGDHEAREELRLRAFNVVHQRVLRTTSRRHSIEATDEAFEHLLGPDAPKAATFDEALAEVLARSSHG